MKIDFCIILTGALDNVSNSCLTDIFVPIFFNSLFATTDTSDLIFHILDDSKNEKTRLFLEETKAKMPINTFYIYHPVKQRNHNHRSDLGTNVYQAVKSSVACNSNWMLDNCGFNEWVILSHFDILFKKDYVKWLVEQIHPVVGLIGIHNDGIMMINRKAYCQCPVKFEAIGNCFAIKNNEGRYHIRFGSDCRCENHEMMIQGFDNGELLEIFIQSNGWKFISVSTQTKMNYFWHIASGSGHAGEVINQLKREKWSNFDIQAIQKYLSGNL